MKIFLVISFFCPVTTYTVNPYNTEFILSHIFVAFFLLGAMKMKSRVRMGYKGIFFFCLLLYTTSMVIISGFVNADWWSLLNRLTGFLFFYVIYTKTGSDYFAEQKLYQFLFGISLLSVVLSIVFYFLGGDAVNFFQFQIDFTSQNYGVYFENRLTWIFGHKVRYGMVLNLLLYLAVSHKAVFRLKRYFYGYCLIILCALWLSASTINWIFTVGIVVLYLWENHHSVLVRLLKYIVFPIGLAAVLYNISQVRNLLTLGGRIRIWSQGITSILENPTGFGLKFMTENKYAASHNTFLIEMQRHSALCGLLFLILYALILFLRLRKGAGIRHYILILLSTVTLLMDNVLADSFFTLYILLFTMCLFDS